MRDAVLMATLVAPGLKSCMKSPDSRPKRLAANHSPKYCLGLGNHYRLGDASFTLYPRGREEADGAFNLTPDSRESFRRTVIKAADSVWNPVRQPPKQCVRSIVPPSDGTSYWFGIASGLRLAKLLLTDLDSDSRSHFGWPIYWTKWRAYVFTDKDGVRYEADYPTGSARFKTDHASMCVAEAKELVEKDFSSFE